MDHSSKVTQAKLGLRGRGRRAVGRRCGAGTSAARAWTWAREGGNGHPDRDASYHCSKNTRVPRSGKSAWKESTPRATTEPSYRSFTSAVRGRRIVRGPGRWTLTASKPRLAHTTSSVSTYRGTPARRGNPR